MRRLLALHTLTGRAALLSTAVIAGWLLLLGVGLERLLDWLLRHRATHRVEDTALIVAAGVAGLVLLVAYPVLRWTIARALRPVEAMTWQAAEWSAHSPTERFGAAPRLTELQELATTLDGVLDRYSTLLRHERQLSGELSHELRTPLATLRAEADLLAAHADPSVRRTGERMAEQSARMDRILDTLLTTARSELTATPGTCLLDDVLDALAVPVHREGTAVRVAVDGAVLERILAPILANAQRFARTSIEVTARPGGGAVRIDIGNDGPALPDDPERLFEPGVRGDDEHDSAGLGLALARRLARAADGDVTVATADPAAFRVTLPGER